MATVSLGGTLVEKIEAVAGAGFDSIELFDEDFRTSGLTAREVARRCEDLGLGIESYQPFRRAEGVSDTEFVDVVGRFRDDLQIMSDLGTRSIVVVSNTDDDAIADRDRSAGQLNTLATIAAEHGKELMFEALSWGTHTSRLADAWDVLRRAGLTDGRLVLDTFHLFALGDGVPDVTVVPQEAFGLVQLADAPLTGGDLMQWSRNHRRFPGEGEFDVPSVAQAVLDAGFTGTISLEIFNPGYRLEPPAEVARRGAESVRDLLARCDLATTTPR